MRFSTYFGASAVLAGGVLLKATSERSNFYSACIYIAQSNACLLILANLFLLLAGTLMFSLQRLFYGSLRSVEIEQLYERGWIAVTETCLAMTIFREEVGAWFIIMFVSLLACKVWGWIAEGRVEILEQQPPQNPRTFHARLSSSLLLALIVNASFLRYTTQTVQRQARPTMMLVFAFEFAVVSVISVSTILRYIISLTDLWITRQQTRAIAQRLERANESDNAAGAVEDDANEPPGWEAKSRWIFYLDLATDFCKLVVYLAFFCVLCAFYGMPIHILRDVAMTMSSFYKRVRDFMRYRSATKDMHARYPAATQAELQTSDVCIICRESMTVPNTDQPLSERDRQHEPKKLPCGHILHFACLRSWLERQQNCPTCRRSVMPTDTGHRQAPGPNVQAGDRNRNQGHEQRQDTRDVAQDRNALPQGQPGPPAVEQRRLRYYNLGPIRVAVTRVVNGRIPPSQQPPPSTTPAAPLTTDTSAVQPTVDPQNLPSSGPDSITRDIANLHERLSQEAQRLNMQMQELGLLTQLNNEIQRLQQVQNERAGNQLNGSVPTLDHTSNSSGPSLPTGNEGSAQHQSFAQPIPGLSLPEGWTIMPLQRVNGSEGRWQIPQNAAGTSVNTDQQPPQRDQVNTEPLSTTALESSAPTTATQHVEPQEELHASLETQDANDRGAREAENNSQSLLQARNDEIAVANSSSAGPRPATVEEESET